MKIDITNRQLYYINMKNQTKKNEGKVYTASQVGAMLERVDDTVKILAEGHSNLVESHSKLAKTQDKILEVQYEMKNRLEKVETKIDRLQDDMVEVKFELKKKVSTDDFEKLEKRVVKLEKLSYSH